LYVTEEKEKFLIFQVHSLLLMLLLEQVLLYEGNSLVSCHIYNVYFCFEFQRIFLSQLIWSPWGLHFRHDILVATKFLPSSDSSDPPRLLCWPIRCWVMSYFLLVVVYRATNWEFHCGAGFGNVRKLIFFFFILYVILFIYVLACNLGYLGLNSFLCALLVLNHLCVINISHIYIFRHKKNKIRSL
jgi:hypothetical protein